MKLTAHIFFIVFVHSVFAQEIVTKSFFSDAEFVEINLTGLDEVKIENSENKNFHISLTDENPSLHGILVKPKDNILKIAYNLDFVPPSKTVFKKFIIKRLNRATSIIKIPKNKQLLITGTNIDIISNNYEGDLKIHIIKGLIKLNKVQKNAEISIVQGNVYAELSDSNYIIFSKKGELLINNKKIRNKATVKKVDLLSSKKFKLHSHSANVYVIVK